MTKTKERLEADFQVLLLIDRRRAETGDPNLGSAIESVILRRWLEDESQVSASTTPGYADLAEYRWDRGERDQLEVRPAEVLNRRRW